MSVAYDLDSVHPELCRVALDEGEGLITLAELHASPDEACDWADRRIDNDELVGPLFTGMVEVWQGADLICARTPETGWHSPMADPRTIERRDSAYREDLGWCVTGFGGLSEVC